jgi:hypothetical protein
MFNSCGPNFSTKTSFKNYEIYNYTTSYLKTKFSLKNIIPINAEQKIYNKNNIKNNNFRLFINLL